MSNRKTGMILRSMMKSEPVTVLHELAQANDIMATATSSLNHYMSFGKRTAKFYDWQDNCHSLPMDSDDALDIVVLNATQWLQQMITMAKSNEPNSPAAYCRLHLVAQQLQPFNQACALAGLTSTQTTAVGRAVDHLQELCRDDICPNANSVVWQVIN